MAGTLQRARRAQNKPPNTNVHSTYYGPDHKEVDPGSRARSLVSPRVELTFEQGRDAVIVERPLLAALREREVEGEGISAIVSAVPNAKLLGLCEAPQALSEPLRFLEA